MKWPSLSELDQGSTEAGALLLHIAGERMWIFLSSPCKSKAPPTVRTARSTDRPVRIGPRFSKFCPGPVLVQAGPRYLNFAGPRPTGFGPCTPELDFIFTFFVANIFNTDQVIWICLPIRFRNSPDKKCETNMFVKACPRKKFETFQSTVTKFNIRFIWRNCF